MKALLVTIPPLEPYYPPPILPILASCCDQAGVEYQIKDCNLFMYDTFDINNIMVLSNDLISQNFSSNHSLSNYNQVCDYLLQSIASYQPDFVCISIFSYHQHFAADILLAKISDTNYNGKVIIGGSGVFTYYKNSSNFGQYCIDSKLITHCIYGDGEKAFVQLLQGNENYPGINNTNYEQITDLDQLPSPNYDQIDPRRYHYPFEPGFIITGSRGCVRDCSFCNVKDIWNKFVYKSGTKIAQEVYELYLRTGISNFTFSDSLINGSIRTFREFNQRLIQLRKQNSNFKPRYKGQFICRPVGQMKESDYSDMYEAGVDTLVVGIESFSNSVRDHMRKKFTNDDIDYHLMLCASYGIKNVFLLLTGYVTETTHDHAQNLVYLEKYQVYALSDIISNIGFNVGGLMLLPDSGVPLNRMEQDLAIVYHNTPNGSHDWTSLRNPSLTMRERYRRGAEILLQAVKLGYKVMYINATLDNLERYSREQTPNNTVIPIES